MTAFYREINSDKDHLILQDDIKQLEIWASNWGMRFNAKTCYILSLKKQKHKFYQLNGQILEHVQSNPYPGLQILEDLKWKEHITSLTKKASSTSGFLRRNLQHCPREYRKTAYLALVRSIMDYGSIIWDPYTQTETNTLESVQRRGARFITKDYRTREEGCMTQMLKDLNLSRR